MIIPIPALWGRQSTADPNDRIERAIYHRAHRMIAGLSIDPDFQSVLGALIVSVGHGKFIRLSHAVEVKVTIPPAISQLCREFYDGQQQNISQLAPLLSELAEVQANAVEKIKCHAGKYVDRVMAVAVADPGLWTRDFDQRVSYTSFCDANRLAELAGLTVLDSFPARDLAVGGSGHRLNAIPLWMLLADRDAKIAEKNRAVLVTTATSAKHPAAFLIPASDGLDAELPLLETLPTTGFSFLNQLIAQLPVNVQAELEKHFAAGRSDKQLLKRFQENLALVANSNPSLLMQRPADNSQDAAVQPLLATADSYLQANPQQLNHLIRTSIMAVADQFADQLERSRRVSELVVAADAPLEACLINRLEQQLANTSVSTVKQFGISATGLPAIVAAILGLMHVDQMPGNVPWLTGAHSQRILGRITPGRPSNWRQLLRSMADFQPAAMKLKDAV